MNNQAQLAEYNMLRNDIHQRIGFRFQLFSLLLVALGALLPLGIEQENPNIFLVYPILSFFLMMSWMHQSIVMVKLARYLRNELEPNVEGFNWEGYIIQDSKRFSNFSIIGFFAAGGFVLFSQWLMLALGFLGVVNADDKSLLLTLKIASTIASILTLVFLIIYSRMKR